MSVHTCMCSSERNGVGAEVHPCLCARKCQHTFLPTRVHACSWAGVRLCLGNNQVFCARTCACVCLRADAVTSLQLQLSMLKQIHAFACVDVFASVPLCRPWRAYTYVTSHMYIYLFAETNSHKQADVFMRTCSPCGAAPPMPPFVHMYIASAVRRTCTYLCPHTSMPAQMHLCLHGHVAGARIQNAVRSAHVCAHGDLQFCPHPRDQGTSANENAVACMDVLGHTCVFKRARA